MASDIDYARSSTPAMGATATVLSLSNEEPYPATIDSWLGTDAGLVVSAQVTVAPHAARVLTGQPVLVSAHEQPRGFTVFSGIARTLQGATLDFFGIVTVVHEKRRRDLRGPADGRVRVSTMGRTVPGMQAVDLCRSGVRVSLGRSSALHLGEQVVVEVDLGYGMPVDASGIVTRIDLVAGHAVVQFDDLSEDNGTMIDRFVMLQLPRQSAAS